MAGSNAIIIIILVVFLISLAAAGLSWYENWTCGLGFGYNCPPSSTPLTTTTPSTTTMPSTSTTPSTSSGTAADGFYIGQAFSCNANDSTGASVTNCGNRGCTVYGYFGNKTMKAFNNMSAAFSYDPTFLSTGTPSNPTIIDCAGLTFGGNVDVKPGTLVGCTTTSTPSGYQSTGPIVAGQTGKFTCPTNTCGGLWAYKGNNVLDYIQSMALVNQYYSGVTAVPIDCSAWVYGGLVTSASI